MSGQSGDQSVESRILEKVFDRWGAIVAGGLAGLIALIAGALGLVGEGMRSVEVRLFVLLAAIGLALIAAHYLLLALVVRAWAGIISELDTGFDGHNRLFEQQISSLTTTINQTLLDNRVHQQKVESTRIQDLERLIRLLSSGNRIPHLLTWYESHTCERAAQHVMCLTSTLIWANEYIEHFIQDVITHPDNRYCYLVYMDEDASHAITARANAKRIAQAIDTAEAHGKKVKDKLEILFLDEHSPAIGVPPALLHLPLPGDVVIYENIRATHEDDVLPVEEGATIVAISTVRVSHEVLSGADSLTSIHDLRLDVPSLIKPIQFWFQSAWNSHALCKQQLATINPE